MPERGDRLLIGTRKGLMILERSAADWRIARHAHEGIPVAYAALDTRNDVLWACLDHGHWGQKLSRSTDGGRTWEEVTAPSYPEGARIKDDLPATVRYLWVLAPGGADQPQRLYIGTEPGGLFQSDDGGSSWQLVESLWNRPERETGWFGGGRDHPGIHSILVDPRDSRRVQVGISCAGVFETLDGGASWSPRNRGLRADFLPDPTVDVGHDPHCVMRAPSNPDVLWQQNHVGIYRSSDSGGSWEEVSQPEGPARFGFPVSVHETDPDSAWVVPGISDQKRMAFGGGLCVARTKDGGRSWRVLERGLPQEHCYDVVLRHALDLCRTELCFGSTTGNVYASGDHGESWRPVGHHFPPVYSVRFA